MEATLQTGLDLRARARFIGVLAGFSAGVLALAGLALLVVEIVGRLLGIVE